MNWHGMQKLQEKYRKSRERKSSLEWLSFPNYAFKSTSSFLGNSDRLAALQETLSADSAVRAAMGAPNCGSTFPQPIVNFPKLRKPETEQCS